MTDHSALIAAEYIQTAEDMMVATARSLAELRRNMAITLHYECGMSQPEIAQLFGVSKQAIGQWCKAGPA